LDATAFSVSNGILSCAEVLCSEVEIGEDGRGNCRFADCALEVAFLDIGSLDNTVLNK